MAFTTTVTRPGQVNNAGSALALFLKVFAGEVLTTFEETNVMKALIQMRTIPYGKSAQFPVTGRADAVYHTPGVNLLDSTNSPATLFQIPSNERVINVDNKLISATTINSWDEAVNHYDVRSVYSGELGRALSKKFDLLGINTAILAARASATISGLNGGGSVTDANIATQGVALSNALLSAAQSMDQKDVPKDGRVAIISPAMFYNLIRDPSVTMVTSAGVMVPTAANPGTGFVGAASNGYPLLNSQLSGGNGNFAAATLTQVAGFRIYVSNHIPSTNIASNDAFFGTGAASANGNTYYGDFTKTKGVAFHPSAIGGVKVQDIALESEYKIEFQGTLMLAKLIMGLGILRPECAVELATP